MSTTKSTKQALRNLAVARQEFGKIRSQAQMGFATTADVRAAHAAVKVAYRAVPADAR